MARYVALLVTFSCLFNCQKATDSFYGEYTIAASENDSLYNAIAIKRPHDERIALLQQSVDSLAATVDEAIFALDSIRRLGSIFGERKIVQDYLGNNKVVGNIKNHLGEANKALRLNSIDSTSFTDIKLTNSDTTRIDNLPLALLKALLSGLLSEVRLAERKILIDKISYDTISD